MTTHHVTFLRAFLITYMISEYGKSEDSKNFQFYETLEDGPLY